MLNNKIYERTDLRQNDRLIRLNNRQMRQRTIQSHLLGLGQGQGQGLGLGLGLGLGSPLKSLITSECRSKSSGSQKTTGSSRSKNKQNRLLLRDYLFLTNKNSEKLKHEHKMAKEEIRKVKYTLNEQNIYSLMQDQMRNQLNDVIKRLDSLKNNKIFLLEDYQQHYNSDGIGLIYGIKTILKQHLRKGIQQINMLLFQSQHKKSNNQYNQSENIINLHSDGFFNAKSMRKKQHKVSLQPIYQFHSNQISINGQHNKNQI